MNLFLHKSAVFSPCRTWRYLLSRIWDMTRLPAMFIGLNPSTADEINNDNTVTRCLGYARDWGYGGLVMANIFAVRTKDPKIMKAQADPIGPENNSHLAHAARSAGLIIAAWGNDGAYRGRSREVVRMLREARVELHCLRLTKQGEPGHPLYLPKNMQPIILRTS